MRHSEDRFVARGIPPGFRVKGMRDFSAKDMPRNDNFLGFPATSKAALLSLTQVVAKATIHKKIAHFFVCRASIDKILSTRLWCRPPANGVASQIARISRAASSEISLAPSVSTLASLCSRELRAVARS